MSDKTFAAGFIAKRSEKAPDWVACSLSIKVDEALPFLIEYQREGWVNLQVKQAKSGKFYVELDTWQPTQGEAAKTGMAMARESAGMRQTVNNLAPDPKFPDDDIPF